jgi:hypothetical protein
MKQLSTTTLIVATAIGLAASIAEIEAASITSYVASDSPGSAPDANGNTFDAWTVSTITPPGGGAGSFYGFGNSWVLYSFPDGAAAGSAFADHTFAGGALGVGQTVSIQWANSAVQTGSPVGVSLMSGGTAVATVKFVGGAPGGIVTYDDAGGTNQSTGVGFAYQTLRPFLFKLDSGTTYSASFNGTPWTGTLAGSPIDGIRVFNSAGGNGSDVFFNNLAIVPEPSATSAMALAMLVGVCLSPFQRRTR